MENPFREMSDEELAQTLRELNARLQNSSGSEEAEDEYALADNEYQRRVGEDEWTLPPIEFA